MLLFATPCSPLLPCVPYVALCYSVLPCVPPQIILSSTHTKKSIPYTMALRQRRICSTDDFFNKRLNALTTHLINTAYKHCFIQQEINKVRLIPRSHAHETSTRQESDRVPFVVTFNPALPNMNPGHVNPGNHSKTVSRLISRTNPRREKLKTNSGRIYIIP